MTNAELIAGLRECATVGDCSKCKMHDEYSYDMCAIKLLLAAADALEECMKKENALRSLIDGRGDPVSCNVDAILKGEYE